MLKIAVCDDSPTFLDNAVSFINKWSEQSGIATEVHTCENGDELISLTASTRIDVVFLDIIMPLLNGIDTAKELRARDSAVRIIFLTSSPEFALESYEVKAQNYLLKPVSYEKIKESLDECARFFSYEPLNIVIKTVFGYQKIYFQDIEYAEAQNKRVIFYLRSGKEAEAVEPLYSFEDKLIDANGFFKCHRSYIVYIPNVDHFGNTEITTKSGKIIPIARGYAKAFKDAYFALMFKD